MEDNEFEKFMDTAELCAKEVLGVFDPNILKKIELLSYPINTKKLSSEFIIENNELMFFNLSYSHRKILINNDYFYECCKELLNNFIFQYKCGKINFYNTEYYQTILKNAAINHLNSLSENCLIHGHNSSIFTNINELSLLTYEKK